MAFITQEDILSTFEGLVRHLFKHVKGIDMPAVPHMTYAEAMKFYGSDKPDTRFDMRFVELTDIAKGKGFPVFDQSELVVAICAKGCAHYTRKQLDELTEFVKRPQIGASIVPTTAPCLREKPVWTLGLAGIGIHGKQHALNAYR
jgi:aspartyl-tRNA synthetase